MRLIKKYPNRRLYDTEISRYITLDDVRQLVLEHVEFRVEDARSKKDITRNILLQIILEQEEDGEPIFSAGTLQDIVRFYGHDLQGAMSSFIERSLQMFVEQQDVARRQLDTVLGADALGLVRDMTERNLALWKDMQESFLHVGRGGRSDREKSD